MDAFALVEELARGPKGSVWKAKRRRPRTPPRRQADAGGSRSEGEAGSDEDDDAGVVVLKERRMAELGRGKSVANEVDILRKIRHPHVVRLLSSFTERGVLWMELEFAAYGDLDREVSSRRARRANAHFETAQVHAMALQIMDALSCLHAHRIVHRDIKSMNVFIFAAHRIGEGPATARGIVSEGPADREFVLKVGDLGVSRFCSQRTHELSTFYGTPLYASPEICDNRPYDHRTDLWSCGVLLYELSELVHPFSGPSLLALAQDICRGKYAPATAAGDALCEVIEGLLQVDARSRMSLREAMALLRAASEDEFATEANESTPVDGDREPTPPELGSPAQENYVGSAVNALTEAKLGEDDDREPEEVATEESNGTLRGEHEPQSERSDQRRIEAALRRKRVKLKNLEAWIEDSAFGDGDDQYEKAAELRHEIAELEDKLASEADGRRSSLSTSKVKFASTSALPRWRKFDSPLDKSTTRTLDAPTKASCGATETQCAGQKKVDEVIEDPMLASKRKRDARLAARRRARQDQLQRRMAEPEL